MPVSRFNRPKLFAESLRNHKDIHNLMLDYYTLDVLKTNGYNNRKHFISTIREKMFCVNDKIVHKDQTGYDHLCEINGVSLESSFKSQKNAHFPNKIKNDYSSSLTMKNYRGSTDKVPSLSDLEFDFVVSLDPVNLSMAVVNKDSLILNESNSKASLNAKFSLHDENNTYWVVKPFEIKKSDTDEFVSKVRALYFEKVYNKQQDKLSKIATRKTFTSKAISHISKIIFLFSNRFGLFKNFVNKVIQEVDNLNNKSEQIS